MVFRACGFPLLSKVPNCGGLGDVWHLCLHALALGPSSALVCLALVFGCCGPPWLTFVLAAVPKQQVGIIIVLVR